MVSRRYPETRYVKTQDGFHIAYQVFGEGPSDLVINDGWMANVDANWDLEDMARLYDTFAQSARVIVFDRRGFGASDRTSSPREMSLEKGLDDMRAVLDAVGSDRPVLYGFEAGGCPQHLVRGDLSGADARPRPRGAAGELVLREPVGRRDAGLAVILVPEPLKGALIEIRPLTCCLPGRRPTLGVGRIPQRGIMSRATRPAAFEDSRV